MTCKSRRISSELRWPNLSEHNYRKTSRESWDYNCIAWTVFTETAAIWPYEHPDYFWPSNIPNNESVEAFIAFYSIYGYEVCSNSNLEEGFQKIALYVIDDNDEGTVVTHAARQLSSGRWSSKLGPLQDIEHDTLDGIENRIYGQAAIFMRRPYAS